MRTLHALHDDLDVRRGLQLYVAFADVELPAIAQIFSRIYGSLPAFAPMMERLEPNALLEQNRASMVHIRKGTSEGDWGDYIDDLEERGVRYARAGVAFADWSGVFAAAQVAVVSLSFERGPTNKDELRQMVMGVGALFDTIVQIVGRTYFDAQQKALTAEADLVRDLSTPVLEIEDGVLLVPLIGHLDARRGGRLRTAVLGGLRERGTELVVIDLTGVATTDADAAAELRHVVEAARLMGARVVLCGLSASVCDALVGTELGTIETHSSLQDALQIARRKRGGDPRARLLAAVPLSARTRTGT